MASSWMYALKSKIELTMNFASHILVKACRYHKDSFLLKIMGIKRMNIKLFTRLGKS